MAILYFNPDVSVLHKVIIAGNTSKFRGAQFLVRYKHPAPTLILLLCSPSQPAGVYKSRAIDVHSRSRVGTGNRVCGVQGPHGQSDEGGHGKGDSRVRHDVQKLIAARHGPVPVRSGLRQTSNMYEISNVHASTLRFLHFRDPWPQLLYTLRCRSWELNCGAGPPSGCRTHFRHGYCGLVLDPLRWLQS